MSKLISHNIYLGTNDDGKHIVASGSSPYFCFEADSEDEAREIAKRALNFYFGKEGRIRPAVERKERAKTRVSRVFRSRVETIEIEPAAA